MLRRLLSSLAPPKSHRLTGENDLPLAAVRVAGCLIEELAGIGAKIETTGNDLVLRAGPHPIPSQLVRRVRDAKSDLIAVLRTNSLESQVVVGSTSTRFRRSQGSVRGAVSAKGRTW